jgi:Thioredoxin-like [2Fe-2S] ferredoxin
VAVFSQTIRVAAATGGRGDVDMRCVGATLNVRSMGPKAEAAIQVCVGLPFCLNGARGLVREAEKKLGTKSGTATADGRFAIVEVECTISSALRSRCRCSKKQPLWGYNHSARRSRRQSSG